MDKTQGMLRICSKGKKSSTSGTSNSSVEVKSKPKYQITEAMRRAKMKMQEKFRRVTQKAEKKKKKNERGRQRQQGNSGRAGSSTAIGSKSEDKNNNEPIIQRRRRRHFYPLVKGKNYKTKDDREPKEISWEKYFEINYILSPKPSRSVWGGFSLRKLQDHRLGSSGRRRVDRPQCFEDHDDEERGC